MSFCESSDIFSRAVDGAQFYRTKVKYFCCMESQEADPDKAFQEQYSGSVYKIALSCLVPL